MAALYSSNFTNKNGSRGLIDTLKYQPAFLSFRVLSMNRCPVQPPYKARTQTDTAREAGRPFLRPQPLHVERSLLLLNRPLATRAPVSLGPIDHEHVTARGSLLRRLMVPRAAVSPRPLQNLEMPPSGGARAGRLVPGAAIRMRPLKHIQVA